MTFFVKHCSFCKIKLLTNFLVMTALLIASGEIKASGEVPDSTKCSKVGISLDGESSTIIDELAKIVSKIRKIKTEYVPKDSRDERHANYLTRPLPDTSNDQRSLDYELARIRERILGVQTTPERKGVFYFFSGFDAVAHRLFLQSRVTMSLDSVSFLPEGRLNNPVSYTQSSLVFRNLRANSGSYSVGDSVASGLMSELVTHIPGFRLRDVLYFESPGKGDFKENDVSRNGVIVFDQGVNSETRYHFYIQDFIYNSRKIQSSWWFKMFEQLGVEFDTLITKNPEGNYGGENNIFRESLLEYLIKQKATIVTDVPIFQKELVGQNFPFDIQNVRGVKFGYADEVTGVQIINIR